MKRSLIIPAILAVFTVLAAVSGPSPARAEDVTVMAVGDILPHASWQPFQLPTIKLFEGVMGTLYEADVVIGNLESPLTGRVAPTPAKSVESLKNKKNFIFKAEDENTARDLRDAGLTVLSLANNHVMDYKEEGLIDTLDRLEKVGIKTAGAGRNSKEAYQPREVKAKGMDVFVLAASDVVPESYEAGAEKPGVASMKDEGKFVERVRKVRKMYPDALLVLSLHWGAEATYKPTQRQKELAHRLVDAGADVILGHHPHRIQGVEIYNQRPVFYSLGNFQFDTNEPGDETFIARLVYEEGSRVPAVVSVIPVKIKDGGYPVVLEHGSAAYSSIIKQLDEFSAPFGMKLDGEAIVPLPPSKETGYDYWGT